MTATLTVVATPIGNLADLSPRAADALRDADLVLAEDTRRTGRLLAHIGADTPQLSLHEHNERARIDQILDRLRAGEQMVLVTDAGTPLVSDPGQRLVGACVEHGIPVQTIPGPSAVLAALTVAGLPVDRVAFDGFLPRKGAARARQLAALAGEERTIVLFLSPHRAADDLADLATALGAERPAVVARELTKLHEEVLRGTLASLAEQASEGLRGELTLVVAGRPPDPRVEVSPAELRERVEELRAQGATTRDAVDRIAQDTGLPRRRVYDAVHSSED